MIDPRYWLVPVLALMVGCAGAQPVCDTRDGVTLQVLGSGGPITDDDRAGTSYLVWVDGESRFLIDLGGGSSVRFAAAGASFNDLDFVALSHLHTDHSSDLPALLKSGNFAGRKRPLGISGPSGSGPFPAFEPFLQALIGSNGAYAYLSGYLDGSGNLPLLAAQTVDVTANAATRVYTDKARRITIDALGVPHGIVPALAYRLNIGEMDLVFASDQNGNDERFVDFARNADILVMHMVVPEDIQGVGRKLHAPPSRIGEIASAANADTLVLSHFMARSLRDIETNVALVDARFDGTVVTANDLTCVAALR
ncbi:MAG: MBL fold metallo-hydrolase [Gammaproteobacteria bacterium]